MTSVNSRLQAQLRLLEARKAANSPDDAAELWHFAFNALAMYARKPLGNFKDMLDLKDDMEALIFDIRKARAKVHLADSDIGNQMDRELEVLEQPLRDLMEQTDKLYAAFETLSKQVQQTVQNISEAAAQSAKDAGW